MTSAPCTRPIRLLLLEDDEADRFATMRMLSAADTPGFDVIHASSVAEALVRLRQESPDIVLTDLCVSDSEGLPTFRALQRAAPTLPIVVLSGLSERDTAIAAVRSGAQDYLCKTSLGGALLVRSLRHALERQRGERALRESEQRFTLAVNGANDGLWDWRLDGGLYVSPRWRRMLDLAHGDEPSSAEGWFAAIHPDDYDAFSRELDRHLRGLSPHFEHEHRILGGGGRWYWVLTRGLAVRDDRGTPLRMAGSQTDISARKQAEARLRHEALHDSLTGLPNRTLCLDRIGHAIGRAQRDPDHRFALLFVDLDRFKVINDSLGHTAGDELLRAFARRCARLVRPGDTFARLGGDEFCVLLDRISGDDDASRVADRVHRALKAPFVIDDREVFVSASVGICFSDPQHDRAEDMLRDADVAMYRAKAAGRGCQAIFDPAVPADGAERLDLETDLRRAIERGELALCFQPIITLADRRVTGVEALLRWHSRSHGAVTPDVFIPLAEETGLILPIGRWTLDAAVRTAALWSRQAPRAQPLSVSVNLSPLQFADEGLIDHVRACLAATGLPPSALVLEITENVLVTRTDEAIATLRALRALGVRIHLDDFGTGFSSLRYLQRLPIDKLKIDRSFVAGLPASRDDHEIVRTIVELGRHLGKGVVAEGIETNAQHDALLKLGCTYGQGYLYGRPDAALPTVGLAA